MPCGLAAARHRRGTDHRRGHHSHGNGVCNDGRAAGAGRSLYRPGADGDIRGAWNIARAQRQHDFNLGDPDRRSVGAGRPQWQPRSAAESLGNVDAAGGSRTLAGAPVASGNGGELYLRAVLVGFRAGIGLVIVVDQIPKILGIHFTRGTFVRNVLSIVHTLPRTSFATLAVGLTIIVFLLSMGRFLPKLPAPLLAVAAAITGAYFLNLQHRGVELVGHIPPGLPSLSKPDLSLITVLWPGALGIALMSFTETAAAGRAFARNDEVPRADRDLLATGLANIGGALLGAMPGGGGTTQTAVNFRAGARTQLAEMVTAATALVTILFLAPVVAMMPQSALAALVIVYSFGLIKPIEFREILSVRRTEFSWAIVAFAGVVLVGTLKGIIVAIVVSLVTLAYHVADPPVYVLRRKPGTNVFRPQSPEHPEDESFPGLLLLRPEGPIFFANAAQIAHKIEPLVRETQPKVVAVDASGVLDLEYTALKMFAQVAKRQSQDGIQLWLIGMNPEVLAVVQRSPLAQILRREGMHFNLEIAVARYLRDELVLAETVTTV